MKVSTAEPFQIIYSLFQHEYLGFLFESFVVQVDHSGKLTLKHQNISYKNASEFASGLDDKDYTLIKLIDSINQDVIVRKFHNKKITPSDFFLKVYNKEKGDQLVQDAIARYVEDKKAEILKLLDKKMVFEMGSDGEPTWKQVFIAPKKASVLFHFMRNDDNTHYFPTIKYDGEKLDFQYKNAMIICKSPAWMLLGDRLFTFEKDVDGQKLKPFLNKKFIVIPRKVEETYFEKFVTPLIGSFDVHAKGFTINAEKFDPVPILSFTELPSTKSGNLFGDDQKQSQEDSESGKMVFTLAYQYGHHLFPSTTSAPSYVKMEKTLYSYVFHKVKRQSEWEKKINADLRELGMELKNGKKVLEKGVSFSWIHQNKDILKELGIQVRQSNKDNKKYFMGQSSISMEVKESNDWFDIEAVVRFGEFEIPFLKLRQYILKKIREFQLPNGEIAVIPEEWFSQYGDILAFMEEDENLLKLKKHHLSLVHELQEGNLAQITMDRKLEKLKEFQEIEDMPLPGGFSGELRPYQKAGYNWMLFLNKYNFGGCLADDMGLGKTVQTLALLQDQKERGAKTASLLIMPTSLLYNWEMEAKKFTPDLKVFNYTGINREKNVEQFEGYDIILTSYGTTRRDIDHLKEYFFHYIILDESQAIKNPDSNIARAVKDLKSKFRLILSGTPVENSTMDIWSQMAFINPGLLGSQEFFRSFYLTPIEKKQDEDKTKKLYNIIKPFLLRREKSQVATELPEKIENIQYSSMTPEQEKEYEEVKSSYRNMILDEIDKKGMGGTQILLLQGLMKLRQIANHPRMVDQNYEGTSGKMEDMLNMLDTALGKKHKVLIFSQFVKHLSIVREHLYHQGLEYAYLDGSTKERQGQVELFQNNDDVRIFLISLKAGGLGLNLTAADYVFILDPWWNPAIEAQAVDRAYRIGQKNKVFTYKFITKNTVEEKILNLQRAKQKLASDLITTEESFMKSLTADDIRSIFD